MQKQHAADAQMAVAREEQAHTSAMASAEKARADAAERQVRVEAEAKANAQARARDAEARAEEAKAAAALQRVQLPPDWTSVTASTGLEFVELPPEMCSFFARKMKASVKVTAGTTSAQRMDRLHVHRVVRVENAQLFESYQRERAKIRRWMHGAAGEHDVTRLTEHVPDWLAAKRGFPAVIDADTNEFWLWHGTTATIDIKHADGTVQQQETWEVLARHGFDHRVANDSGLYGAGSYFADASSKSHQYAAATNAAGWHCMLSCRVTMGDPYMTPGQLKGERRPPPNPATLGLPYDSVFAEEGVTNNGHGAQFHNEYVVFAKAQVYPEYVIWYTC
jgi:hypothetical protein